MKRKIFLVFALMLVISFFTASCEDISKAVKVKNDNKTLVDKSDKFQAYAAMDVFIVSELEKSLNFYFGKFGKADKLMVNKNSELSIGDFLKLNPYDVNEAYKSVSLKPSFKEADDALKVLYPKLKDMLSTISDLDAYYKMKGYLDDNFSKGSELHKKLYDERQAVEPLMKNFIVSFENVFLDKSKNDLANFKKSDSMIRYYCLDFVLNAKALESEISNPDSDNYKKKYALITEDIDKFNEFVKDDKRIDKEKLDSDIATADDFRMSMFDVKAEASSVLQHSSSGEKYGKKLRKLVLEYIKLK